MASTATKRIWYAQYACEKSGDFPEVYILIRDREVADPTVEAWMAFHQALEGLYPYPVWTCMPKHTYIIAS